MATKAVTSTVGQLSWKGVVSAAVSFAIAWLTSHIGGFSWVHLSYIWGIVTPAYFAAVTWAEARWPSLSWLFLLFPQPPKVVPTPTPAASTFVKTDNGVWAADVNAMEKAKEVAKTPVNPVASPKPKSPKTKR